MPHRRKEARRSLFVPSSSTQTSRLSCSLPEPLVYDPVEMAFDENGRMFVAEMLDYPDDPPPGQPSRAG